MYVKGTRTHSLILPFTRFTRSQSAEHKETKVQNRGILNQKMLRQVPACSFSSQLFFIQIFNTATHQAICDCHFAASHVLRNQAHRGGTGWLQLPVQSVSYVKTHELIQSLSPHASVSICMHPDVLGPSVAISWHDL